MKTQALSLTFVALATLASPASAIYTFDPTFFWLETDTERIECGPKLILWITSPEFPTNFNRYDINLFSGGREIAFQANVGEDRADRLRALCQSISGRRKGPTNPAQRLTVGDNPVDASLGDFDGNGDPDVAVANSGSDNVSILLNTDDVLGDAVNFPTGTRPALVESGLFNGDSHLDLITANASDLSFLAGAGDGTFAAPVSIAVPGNPQGLRTALLDADSALDLVVGIGNAVAVLLSNGDGTFAPAVSIPVSDGRWVDVGLVNNDAFIDVVTPGELLTGNGDGTFASPVSLGAAAQGNEIRLADLNLDGSLDAVTARRTENLVSVRLGDGLGGFSPPQFYAVGDTPGPIFVTNLNGDDTPGLIVSTQGNTSSIVPANADGSLGAPRNYLSSDTGAELPTGLVSGRYDTDEFIDVVIGQGLGNVAFLKGNGDGSFALPVDLGVAGSQLTTGLFNDDVHLDLAIASSPFGGSRAQVLLGNGDGTFQPQPPIAVNDSDRIDDRIEATSLNSDQDTNVDLLIANSGTGELLSLLGNGDGTFQSPLATAVGTNPGRLAVADLDGNGRQDAVVAIQGQPGSQNGQLAVLLGNGDGTFNPGTPLLTDTQVLGVAAGLIDSDANVDLAVVVDLALFTPDVLIFFGQGDGSFGSPTTLPRPVDFFPSGEVSLSDINGDGDLDVGININNAQAGYYDNDGNGLLSPLGNIEPGERPGQSRIVDSNVDGAPDLIIVAGGGISVLLDPNDEVFADGFESLVL